MAIKTSKANDSLGSHMVDVRCGIQAYGQPSAPLNHQTCPYNNQMRQAFNSGQLGHDDYTLQSAILFDVITPYNFPSNNPANTSIPSQQNHINTPTMDPPEKLAASPPDPELPPDAPPPYTPQALPSTSEAPDERNPATIPSPMGPKKVYTTHHIYLEQNYLRKVKVALVKHLNSEAPSYVFEFPDEGTHAGQMVMRGGGSTPDTAPLATASFGKDFGSSTLQLSDGRIAAISVVPRTDMSQNVRVFRVDVQNASGALHHHPATLFWEMGTQNHGASRGGIGNYVLMDGEGRVYAMLITKFHKSLKKMGRLHWLVEPAGEVVEVGVGSLMAVWKKAERDVRSGHIGLRV
ncbi:hypothetical protein P171DRAFT_440759 [Karstenula rhodostoma CBS 690.94]|uniref:Uncharacterized protein n=1 Tax=Karstenula rhodostoma CBS 690.94 TaxID=1392251 RepID=A0A9P4UFC5_9PLEO|nr:hypothetical protein P171DRAFT_440759 [Karstenula rhodostoma CBS 690.94]